MLSRQRPVRLLTIYLLGGMGLSLIVRWSVFVLKDVGVNKASLVGAYLVLIGNTNLH
ncbi:MAG: hypothetical protein JO168_04925 [Solirubrobacterales bacterium]|nr:hypothetical protein [Solirubrobacterales bacterium]